SVTMTGRASAGGARVRLDIDGITLTTVASDTGAFKFTFSFSGQSGFHLARIRQMGADGSLSADRAICFRVNCQLPRVVNAALDRANKTLTIVFSRRMDATSLVLGSTILLDPTLTGTIAMNDLGDTATIALNGDVSPTITLTVKAGVKDATGASMAADYTRVFNADGSDDQGDGDGYVTGAVYDASTGRPLINASVTIGSATIATNDRGRYSRSLAEGTYTIEASAPGFTRVWRQVVVPAGAGVVPIDIRLTRRGPEQTTNGSTQTLTDGGDSTL